MHVYLGGLQGHLGNVAVSAQRASLPAVLHCGDGYCFELLPYRPPLFNLHPFIFLISHLFSALLGCDAKN